MFGFQFMGSWFVRSCLSCPMEILTWICLFLVIKGWVLGIPSETVSCVLMSKKTRFLCWPLIEDPGWTGHILGERAIWQFLSPTILGHCPFNKSSGRYKERPVLFVPLCRLVYDPVTIIGKKKSSCTADAKYYHMSSFGESKTLKLLEDPITARSLVKYNTKQLSRSVQFFFSKFCSKDHFLC
jgi:hypothetical protein